MTVALLAVPAVPLYLLAPSLAYHYASLVGFLLLCLSVAEGVRS